VLYYLGASRCTDGRTASANSPTATATATAAAV